MKKYFVIVIMLLVLAGTCFSADDGREIKRIDGVLRVFVHQSEDYSVMTLEKGEYKIYRLLTFTYNDVEGWLADLFKERTYGLWNKWSFKQKLLQLDPKDKKMRVEVWEYPNTREIVIKIFITSEEDVEGGNWKEYRKHYSTDKKTSVIR